MIIEERGDIVEQQRGGVEFLERDIYRTVFKGFFKNEMGRKVWIYEEESLGGVYYVGHIIIPGVGWAIIGGRSNFHKERYKEKSLKITSKTNWLGKLHLLVKHPQVV